MSDFPLNFINLWKKENSSISIETSGSTGIPKKINLKKDWLIWSAQQSAKIIDINQFNKLLCCLPTSKIGGYMQLIRAKVWEKNIEIIAPSSNPLIKYKNNADFISLTPHQVNQILENKISKDKLKEFKVVLIGGSALTKNLIDKLNELKNINFYHTYGMTETCSHIGLKKLNEEKYFKKFEEVSLKLNNENCLMIKMPFYKKWLNTNDFASLINENEFQILGRKDFIINTGGVKINPEQIENLIYEELKLDYDILISSIKDEDLGEKIVLYIPKNQHLHLDKLNFLKDKLKFSKPHQIIQTKFPLRNELGKPNRKFFLSENQ